MRLFWSRSCLPSALASIKTPRLPIPSFSSYSRKLSNVTASPRPNLIYPIIDSDKLVKEEYMLGYKPEDFYPVHIGHIFKEKYKIVGKLGYGATSTVWLCRDIRSQSFVTLKICTKTSTTAEPNREIAAYKHLANIRSNHVGQYYIRQPLDIFDIVRPDGANHHCLVYPPLHMTLLELQCLSGQHIPLNAALTKLSIKRLLTALDFLHTEAGIVHCDLRITNLILALPDESLLLDFEEAEAQNPSPRKIIDSERTIYASRRLGKPRNGNWGASILCDFGEARVGLQHDFEYIQPMIYQAPEIVMEGSWTNKVDIWNVACLIWDMFQGKPLFDGHDENDVPNGKLHVSEMVAYMGLPLPTILDGWNRAPMVFDEKGQWKADVKIPSISLESFECRLHGEEKEKFLSFMREMLQWLPENRKSAKELLQHPWLDM